MSYALRGVPPEDIDRAWPQVALFLANSLSRNCRGCTLSDVKDKLKSGHCMLWLVVNPEPVAAVVSFVNDPSKALHVWLMGGERMADWLDTLEAGLSRYAREMGLEALQAEVRPGMIRPLGELGWKPQFTIVRKTL